jgi:NitT/TauT family transport system permease protein
VRTEGKVILVFFPGIATYYCGKCLARSGVVDIRLFSCPSRIMETFVPVLFSGELLYHSWISVRRIILGFAAGAIPGVLLGLSMGLFPLVRAALEPMVAATFPIP